MWGMAQNRLGTTVNCKLIFKLYALLVRQEYTDCIPIKGGLLTLPKKSHGNDTKLHLIDQENVLYLFTDITPRSILIQNDSIYYGPIDGGCPCGVMVKALDYRIAVRTPVAL